jgi:hypothetical protein
MFPSHQPSIRVWRINLMGTSAASGSIILAGTFALVTALFWGAYGPILHKGVTKMGPVSAEIKSGRLRPFLCVGLAYFVVSIVGPIVVMQVLGMEYGNGLSRGWTFWGTILSFAGGMAGALGAFALIMALNYGGPRGPLFVMPLVFGCAPVVSTLVSAFVMTYFDRKSLEISPFFPVGLFLVALGAVTTLLNPPKEAKAEVPPAGKVAAEKSATDAKNPLTDKK